MNIWMGQKVTFFFISEWSDKLIVLSYTELCVLHTLWLLHGGSSVCWVITVLHSDYCTSWWLLYNALLYCVVITVLCGCYRAAPVFVWWTSSWQRWTVWRRGSKYSSWAPQTDQVRTDLYTQALMSYCDWTENQSDITSFYKKVWEFWHTFGVIHL